MRLSSDELSKWIRKALSNLYLDSPIRTSFGILIGVFFNGFCILFSETSPMIHQAAEKLKLWHYLATGIIIINLPNINRLIKKRNNLPENFERFFGALKEMEESGNFSKGEIKLYYIEGLNKLMENLVEQKNSDDQPTKAKKTPAV